MYFFSLILDRTRRKDLLKLITHQKKALLSQLCELGKKNIQIKNQT